MPVLKPRKDIAFLERVDAAYRGGAVIRDIADQEKTSAGGLLNRVNRLGFKFTRDGGLRLVDTMWGRELADWLAKGELDAAPEEGLVAA